MLILPNNIGKTYLKSSIHFSGSRTIAPPNDFMNGLYLHCERAGWRNECTLHR